VVVEVRVLGELECVADEGSVVPIRGVKARTLLAVLALHRGAPVAPDRLMDILWGDCPPGNPVNALQALVRTLRLAIGAANVATTDAGYALSIAPDDVDVVRFERLVADGCRHLQAGDAALASDVLREALGLCRDEPLVEFAYAEFATGERARLQELVLVAVEARAEADLALGRHGELVGELDALCEQHALRERLWELRMLALYRSGRQADALRVYGDARERLVEAFGLEPGPGLRELEARVLAQDPALDLPGARRVGAARWQAGNLRQTLTSFVGREEDLARLVESVRSWRLVTLIGPGGVGKTRLAVEAAATLRAEVADGVWLVELGGVRDPDDVAPAVAATLQANSLEGTAGSTLELVVGHLRGRSLVVVLDNCEHLAGAAAVLADTLVGELPGLRVIATSREPLGVPGEVLFPVRGLGLDAAAAVFADRAQAVRPGFVVDESNRPLVEDVCRRLDGLPLAVELAAARLRALPLGQLAELLDDRFRVLTGGVRTALPRQQTLRAVVDWSFDLLFEDERRLFARLSVFAGGWSLAAAETVCGDELLPRTDILDLLMRLVDKSLVVADVDVTGEARYWQLQTLWHYAAERLAASGDADALRERHARWYLALAAGARKGLRGRTGPAWRAQLTAEWENLRAALDWFVDSGDAEAALSLTEGVAWLWFLRNEPHEAVRWLSEALGVPDGVTPARSAAAAWHAYYHGWTEGPTSAVREVSAAIAALRDQGSQLERLSDALLIAAVLHNRIDQLELAQACLDEARWVLESTGDEWGLAVHDILLAENLATQGDLDAAEDAARSCVARLRITGEAWQILDGLGLLAILREARGDLDGAAAAYRELIADARAADVRNYEMQWVARLAGVCARQGDDQTAAQLFAEAGAAAIYPANIGWALIGRAGAVRRLGDAAAARPWLDEALALYEAMGFEAGCGAALTSLCWWSLAVGDLDEAAGFAAEARRRTAAEPDSHVAMAAEIATAAVACARSGASAHRDRFAALVRQRASSGRRYDGTLAGWIGANFDEPDAAAFARTIGVASPGDLSATSAEHPMLPS